MGVPPGILLLAVNIGNPLLTYTTASPSICYIKVMYRLPYRLAGQNLEP